MTWSYDFPGSGEPEFVAAPDVWQLADLSYIPEIIEAQAVPIEPTEAGLAGAAADGYKRGYEEGRLAGERAERVRLRASFEAADEAICQMTANQSKWATAFEDNLCALATAIARHLMERELNADPALLHELVERARQDFKVDAPVKVRVNPGDLAAMTIVADAAGFDAHLEHWAADPTIAPGGCVIEGPDRIVDGRVDTALERVYRRVTQYDV